MNVTRTSHRVATLLAVAVVALIGARSAHATPPPLTSLNTCQNMVKREAAKYIKNRNAAVGACLQRISTEIVKKGVSGAKAAATCVRQFRKLHDTRGIGASLEEKKTANIRKKCEPGFSPQVTHTLAQIQSSSGLNTTNINGWCTKFGGDGNIGSVQEWIDCIDSAHDCASNTALSVQYPRLLEWLDLIRPSMALVAAPASDINRTTDSLTALDAVNAAIEGSVNDNVPDVECGPLVAPPVCSSACCYLEQTLGLLTPTACFQYTGSASQVTTFKGQCTGKIDSTGTQWVFTAANGACVAGPTYGKACTNSAPGGNLVLIPSDSACP